ncbi:hypothetical protein IscW_ISCW017375 [Ixodes scapularis]|uniref:Uncharacterized protein n=1 Tax=Ixodes scapularis TaxID=6945 RepID=B7PD48_IXOSC|nr:hypothetical protein IscW_ISCW017375 [Ixodes scapularis]|eukprot:XP_002410610.1 hypothetical protein IscW_ISCW017375 [Ixodes scapularis]
MHRTDRLRRWSAGTLILTDQTSPSQSTQLQCPSSVLRWPAASDVGGPAPQARSLGGLGRPRRVPLFIFIDSPPFFVVLFIHGEARNTEDSGVPFVVASNRRDARGPDEIADEERMCT